jgi:hypothetical protein
VQRVFATDEDDLMPPPSIKRPLDARQKEVLRRWWPPGRRTSHWAFVRPVRATLPTVKQRDWPRNALDRFVLDRLEREGQPSPEADRHTLIRRVSLDG